MFTEGAGTTYRILIPIVAILFGIVNLPSVGIKRVCKLKWRALPFLVLVFENLKRRRMQQRQRFRRDSLARTREPRSLPSNHYGRSGPFQGNSLTLNLRVELETSAPHHDPATSKALLRTKSPTAMAAANILTVQTSAHWNGEFFSTQICRVAHRIFVPNFAVRKNPKPCQPVVSAPFIHRIGLTAIAGINCFGFTNPQPENTHSRSA